ncbi:MAG: hypothetical protein SV422_09465 [Pseudomonadota bacterium]|nr:hypothetical protein [Pseudomonadota bacterium]
MRKILIAAFVLVVVAGGGAYWYANDRARALVDERIDEMVASGAYDSASYESLNVGLTGDITLTNVNIVQGPLDYTVQNITVTNLDYANEFPRHIDVNVKGLRVAQLGNTDDPGAAALGAMLQNLPADEYIPLELDYQHLYDPDNAHQLDSTMRLTIPEFFTLDTSSTTRNIEMQTLDQLNNADPLIAQQQLMALMQAAELPSMSMTLQDHGIVDDMLAASAAGNGVSPEDFRRLLVSQAQNFYLFLPQNAQAFAMAAGMEMAEFLEGGKTLTVSVNPEYGGSFQRLQQEAMGAFLTGDYGKISELLHLQIETN